MKSHLLAALVPLFAVAGCNSQAPSASAPPPTQVVAVTPFKKQIVEWDEYVGRLDAVDFVEVRARVSGYLKSIHFSEGQIVQKGDLLVVIDPRPYEAELNGAKARLEESKAELAQAQAQLAEAESKKVRVDAGLTYAQRRIARSKTLIPGNVISQEEFDLQQSELLQAEADVVGAQAEIESSRAAIATAKAAVETADANVAIAQLNLEYTHVTAPITGRVSNREVTEGNLISGGSLQSTLLTTIVSMDPIHCYFDADEQAFLKYTRLAIDGTRQSSRDVKNPAYIALADEKDSFPHKGHMDFVDNRMDTNTGTMRARAIFANPDHTLVPGLFARIRIPGSGSYDALLLPDSAIGTDQAEKYVLVVGEGNKLRRQTVEVGPLSSGLRVIRKGLEGNEQVVSRGLQRVHAGAEVQVVPEELKPLAASDLPNDSSPVPKEEWLSVSPQRDPKGLPTSANTNVATDPAPSETPRPNTAPRVPAAAPQSPRPRAQ
jgi:RND family efflux transporter MFP subunit